MRIFLALCFILALGIGFSRAEAATLTGAHLADITHIDGVEVPGKLSLVPVHIHDDYLVYRDICGPVFLGRDGNRLGGAIPTSVQEDLPAVHCFAISFESQFIAAVFGSVDRLTFDPEAQEVRLMSGERVEMVLTLRP